MVSYPEYHLTGCPRLPIAVITQVLDFSVCEFRSGTPIWVVDAVDAVQITLSALMCLLVVTRFVRESLQVYKVTNQFKLGHYTNLLTKDSMLYFLAYVLVLSFLSLPVSSTKLMIDRYGQYAIILANRHADCPGKIFMEPAVVESIEWDGPICACIPGHPSSRPALTATPCARCSE